MDLHVNQSRYGYITAVIIESTMRCCTLEPPSFGLYLSTDITASDPYYALCCAVLCCMVWLAKQQELPLW